MPFQKGQSGNPGGRAKNKLPDGRTLSELAKDHTEDALKALIRVLQEGSTDSAVVQAATAVLDRGWGRPRQDMGIEMSVGAEMATMLEQARKRAKASS
jgi:hypothetical protein